MIILNATGIIKIQVFDSRLDTWYHWRDNVPAKKGGIFGICSTPAQPAGWYSFGYGESDARSNEEVLKDRKNRYIDNKGSSPVLMEYPHIEISSVSGKYPETTYAWYKTYEEAKAAALEMAEKFPHIVVEMK